MACSDVTRLAWSREAQAVVDRLAPDLPASVYYRDLDAGLATIRAYVTAYVPEVLRGGLSVVDVGAGIGLFLALARAHGDDIAGEDLPPESSRLAAAYAEVTTFLQIPMRRCGFHRYLADIPSPYMPGSVDVFHFRGSLDAILRPFRADLDGAVVKLVALLATALRPGGFVQIHHNQDDMLDDVVAALRRHRAPLALLRDEPAITRLGKAP